MRRPRRIAALVCALALTVPSAALAQSAGDDQYQDPFSGQTQEGDGGGNSGGGGGNSGGGGGGGNAGTGTQSAQADPSGSASQAEQGDAGTGQAGALPRTGFSAALPVAWGLVLLLSGTALRRGARSRTR